MTSVYFIEVIVNKNCNCLKLKEGFFVVGFSREDAMQKIKDKFKVAKDITFLKVYMCNQLDKGLFSAYTEFI